MAGPIAWRSARLGRSYRRICRRLGARDQADARLRELATRCDAERLRARQAAVEGLNSARGRDLAARSRGVARGWNVAKAVFRHCRSADTRLCRCRLKKRHQETRQGEVCGSRGSRAWAAPSGSYQGERVALHGGVLCRCSRCRQGSKAFEKAHWLLRKAAGSAWCDPRRGGHGRICGKAKFGG